MSEGNLNLETGESAILSIVARIPPTHPLGEISASIVIAGTEVSTTVPIKIIVSSDLLTNLTVTVEDEYTYFASGQPLVSNAAVTLINYQRGVRITQSTQQDNGTVTFSDIHEDRYELFVEAPDHRPLRQVIVLKVENPQITVFIERQTVRYTWSVTPVSYQDSYVLNIEADFETHVPIPVVTIIPTKISLDDLELGIITSFQLNITNHGLIRANDLTLQLPKNHPFLHFNTDREELGDLEALSSFIVSVHTSTKTVQKRNSGDCTPYPVSVRFTFVCGTLQIRFAQVTLVPEERNHNCGRFSVRGSGTGIISGSSYTASTRLPCSTKCLRTILLSCATVLLPPVIGCIPLAYFGVNPLDSISGTLSWIQCATGSDILGLLLCLTDVYNDCLNVPRVKRKK